MRNKKVAEFGGHICNTCEYYEPMQGWCKKHKGHRYGCDDCSKWKTASDLVEHRKEKDDEIH